ncbi:UNVERIFIED_ORG: circularly permuted type 2 ATP-grasp protein, partial [Bacillus sp. AZ43]
PADAVALLRAGLEAAAPPACSGTPRLAVLSAGDGDNAWFEHRLLAEVLGVPLVRAADLWPRTDGGVAAAVDGDRVPVDVLYRRFDDGLMAGFRTPIGQPLDVLLTEAVRSGRLGLANVPGNELADDGALSAWVPDLIGFYLDEKPLLPGVRTWVLADDGQWAQVRDRLHELVVVPVSGYGGREAVVGPECSAEELAFLQAEVASAPYRFVAREPVVPTTLPTVRDGGALAPRYVDLRVLSVAGAGDRSTALPAPLTRVAEHPHPASWWAGGTKDTWILR